MRLLVIVHIVSVVHCDDNSFKSPLQPAIDDFTFKFIKNQLKSSPHDNIFFSPLSIEIVYSWLMGGSRGSTRDDIIKTLELVNQNPRINTPDKINKEFGKLSKHYLKDTPDSSILSGNILALRKESIVRPEFMELSKQFIAEVMKQNFGEPAKVRDEINSLISKQTKGMIQKILIEEPNQDITIMLLNAIHFKGKWNESFSMNRTKLRPFKNADGSSSNVLMMNIGTKRNQVVLRRHMEEDYEVLEILYKDSISMYIFLPDSNKKLAQFAAQFDRSHLEADLNALKTFKYDQVSIPKFRFEHKYDLKKILTNMGMKNPFSVKADFAGISEVKKLKVDESYHKAMIEVNEEGTRASAATEIGLSGFSGGFSYFVANRPFMFLVRDRSNSITLFAGIINKLPNSSNL